MTLTMKEQAKDYAFRGNWASAAAAYEEAIKLDPSEATLYQGQGVAFVMIRQYEKAIVAYDKATELNPGDAKLWTGKALAFQMLGRYQESVDAYKQAIKLDPFNKELHVLAKANLAHLHGMEAACNLFASWYVTVLHETEIKPGTQKRLS